jgi:hypothetical protein
MNATAGATGTTGASGMTQTASADTSNYPPCSRTVHDRCVQTHELARKAGRTTHHRRG